MTFSAEPAGEAAEGLAELEVLKAILNREGYLARLIKSARTVSRKFKPEIADIMDLVRAASLDVVEAVVKWRDAKNDHHAAFMWNGVNYLLKMPSDLDYLNEYRAIRSWLGFRVKRNPFCVPYPLEEGAKLFSATIMQPRHIEGGATNDGFSIGGMLASKYQNNYALKDGAFKSVFAGSPYKGKLPPPVEKLNLSGSQGASGAPSGSVSTASGAKVASGASMPSFILNEDMVLLRQAEMVILKEEEKLGVYSLDPAGRLVPTLQVRKSCTIQKADEENARRAGEDELAAPVDPLEKWKDPKRAKDHSLLPERKGRDKSGGALLPLGTKSVNSSIRLPLKPKNNTGNEIQFHANRKKKTIGDRLNEITALRDKVAREMAQLEAAKQKDTLSSSGGSNRPLTEEEKKINEDVAEVVREYTKADKHAQKLVDLKANQRIVTEQERSREIERKRRLLSAEEGRRKGPPSENEPESVYDYYAVIAQTAIRGWLARRYFAWYKVQVVVASTLMQMIVRGCMARIKVGRLLVNSRAAIVIQRSFRGMSARSSCAAMARDYRIAKAAIHIQRIYRGVLAKRRVQMKRNLDKAAKLAVEAVHPKNLFVQDVQELATRIQMAIEEPLTTEFPPDEVLHLIRLATVLLLSGEGQSGMTTYSRIGARYYEEVEGEKLTWEQAMKIVNRPNRFMRRVRAMAFAPVSKPPRLVRVTEAVHTLYKAQLGNPKWSSETFETMGKGHKICVQLFRWMSSMIEVALAQEAFVSFLAQFVPSQAEMQEERHEDDLQAKAERLKKRQYVPNEVLFDAPARPRPLILAFGRDCSAFAKNKIIYETRRSMPGIFVHLDIPEKMGLDLAQMQDVLDARKSILMSVDYGMTRIARNNFLKLFETVTQALIPKPYIVFVSGDENNKRLPEGDQQFGVSRTDMAAMADSDIKTCLERLSWLSSLMLSDQMRTAMIDQAQGTSAPSTSFIAVMEAFFIIQADHDRFRQPDYHIASVSWRATQVLLRDPVSLVLKLRAVKRGRASAHMCNVLMQYLSHRAWPLPSSTARQQSPLLNLIALYVETWTECERLTLERGGIPDKPMLKGSVIGMQAAIIVEDGLDEDDELEAGRRGGWKVAFAQILKGCLQDMRVLKLVQKIDDKMYNVNVYREEGTIYFDTYDPSNSQMYSTSVAVADVPNLLVPNTTASSTGIEQVHRDPPATPKEMYLRLTKLLRFEKASKRYGSRQVLLCRRDNSFLCGIKRKISGHSMLISAYEAALGELYFVAYFPETCSRVSLMVDDDLRLRMMKDSDPSLEFHMSETNLAKEILPYVMDRLTV
ncbi:unnamed protein product, partial [Ectocarpus fasciculatus]